jgi:hypothetical protein
VAVGLVGLKYEDILILTRCLSGVRHASRVSIPHSRREPGSLFPAGSAVRGIQVTGTSRQGDGVLFVDYAGDTVPVIIDRLTGEVRADILYAISFVPA